MITVHPSDAQLTILGRPALDPQGAPLLKEICLAPVLVLQPI